jgi:hypothetical protein
MAVQAKFARIKVMKKVYIWLGAVIILLLVVWGVFWSVKYLDFKNLKNRCIQNLYGYTTISFAGSSSFSDIQSIASDTQASQEIKSISAISADQALQTFKQEHQNDSTPTVTNTLNELAGNPFLPTIALEFAPNQDQTAVLNYITQDAAKYGVLIDSTQQGLTQADLEARIKSIQNSSDSEVSVSALKLCAQGLTVQ